MDTQSLICGYHDWAPGKLRKQVWTFMHMIGTPDEFKNLQGLHSMILLLFPQLHNKITLRQSDLYELIYDYDRIVVPFYEIFKENCSKKRHKFFSNKLI
jgi:hypothetical protein